MDKKFFSIGSTDATYWVRPCDITRLVELVESGAYGVEIGFKDGYTIIITNDNRETHDKVMTALLDKIKRGEE